MLMKMLKQRNKKGFTLIELIVVLVILAILVAAALPTMMGYVNKARKASYLANCRAAYVSGQASITEQMAKGSVVNADVIKGIEEMVPELKDKVILSTDALAADRYVVTITGTGTDAKITKVSYYDKADNELVYVDYTDMSTNVMDN